MYSTKPKFITENSAPVYFTPQTCISGISTELTEMMLDFTAPERSDFITGISAVKPLPQSIAAQVEMQSKIPFKSNREGFVIVCQDNAVSIYSDTDAGISCGVMTFLHNLDAQRGFHAKLIWDYPVCEMRGIKVFLPARDDIAFFKEFVDRMVFFRHNIIMIEVGGAMEYRRHPEINEGWIELCRDLSEYSGKSKKIQESTYRWRKNSFHCQNGGGEFLTQDEVRDIVDYCRARGLEVIPEVPCTSHCDYLLTRHKELAERPDDPYADTFCPSNPDSYKLLFDVFDEVTDVFKPKIMNVGHDEYYSIGVCEKCREKNVADLFTQDITKIHDYLAGKGVQTMIWSDKLMNVTENQGFGGAENKVYFEWDPKKEFLGIIPPTYEAAGRIPKDILCLNWLWSYGAKYDATYTDNGLKVLFGNYNGSSCPDFRERCNENTLGGICSNWGATTDTYLQRNGIYYEMAFNSHQYWDADFDDKRLAEYSTDCFEILYAYKHRKCPREMPGSYIEITHTTSKSQRYTGFVDGVFINHDRYMTGDYELCYTDGTKAIVPITLGVNIANEDLFWFESRQTSDFELNTRISANLREIASTAMPKKIGNKTFYTYRVKNPCPDKELKGLELRLPHGADWTVTLNGYELV